MGLFIDSLNSIHTFQRVEGESPVAQPLPSPPESFFSPLRSYLLQGGRTRSENFVNFTVRGNTPLMFSCIGDTFDHEVIALHLLSLNGIAVNAKNQFGDSALSWATLTGRSKVIHAILEHPSFQQPDIEHMRKNFEKLCSYDFTDHSKFSSETSKSEDKKEFKRKKIEDHERSLQILLNYLRKNYQPKDILSIQESAIKKGLLHGNIRITTIYFMKHCPLEVDPRLGNSEFEDILNFLDLG